ncbi:MAG: SurA N-terminal domain-containing protein [Prevotella sp.]
MAALGTIRKRGVTLIIIIGLGLFAFIAEEAFRSCEATNNEQRQQVGKVLGEKISVQEFQALVDEYQEVIKMTQGRDNLSEEELNQVKDQVWNSYVNSIILKKEAEKLGLTVTDTELQNILKEGTSPILMQTPFVNQQTGRFDASQLTKFLSDYKKASTTTPQLAEQYQKIYNYWKFIEKTLRQQTLAQKYQSLLSHCLISNPVSANKAFKDQNEESDIELASIAYSTINDSKISVSDADIKAKYEEQKEMYRQYVETRDIKYVDFQVLPSAADRKALMASMVEAQKSFESDADPAHVVKKAQSQISYTGVPVSSRVMPRDIATKIDSMAIGQTTAPFETTYDNTLNVIKLISKVQLPDSVEYRQIQVSAETIEKTRERADSIYKAIAAGADFEAIAKKYGQEGKSQWFTSSMYESAPTIDADTKQYIEALTQSEGLKNVAFTQGNLVVQVLSRKAMTTKYVAAIVKHTIDFSKATYSAAYNKFSQFVSESQDGEQIVANAKKYGFKVLERNDLVNSEHNIAGIRSTHEAMKWIFDAKPGKVSPLYECGNNDHLLVVTLVNIHKDGYRDIASLKDILKEQVIRDKKYEQIKQNLAGVTSVDAAKGKGAQVNAVSQITFAAPAFIQATGASEPALSGAVAATKQGQFCPRVIKGNSGAYMFKVVKKAQRAGVKYDEKAMETQLKQQTMQAASRFLYELYLKANVEDNRYLFF